MMMKQVGLLLLCWICIAGMVGCKEKENRSFLQCTSDFYKDEENCENQYYHSQFQAYMSSLEVIEEVYGNSTIVTNGTESQNVVLVQSFIDKHGNMTTVDAAIEGFQLLYDELEQNSQLKIVLSMDNNTFYLTFDEDSLTGVLEFEVPSEGAQDSIYTNASYIHAFLDSNKFDVQRIQIGSTLSNTLTITKNEMTLELFTVSDTHFDNLISFLEGNFASYTIVELN